MELVKVIITAMKEEAETLKRFYGLSEVKTLKNIAIYEGLRGESEETEKIVLIQAGIGKVQASIATTYAFENYDIFKLINIGIVGNVGRTDLNIGDVILPNTFVQHDSYIPSESDEYSYFNQPIFLEYAIGENYNLTKFGLILNGICFTGDQFIDSEEKTLHLIEKYGEGIADMEAYAILSVAREYNALDKCVMIKSISDNANEKSRNDHMSNLEFAMHNSIQILDTLL